MPLPLLRQAELRSLAVLLVLLPAPELLLLLRVPTRPAQVGVMAISPVLLPRLSVSARRTWVILTKRDLTTIGETLSFALSRFEKMQSIFHYQFRERLNV